MNQIIFYFQVLIAIIFIIIGFIMFKAVNTTFKQQKNKLENPQKEFEKYQKFISEKGFLILSHTSIGRIVPTFLVIIGIAMLIAAFIK